MTTLKNDGEHYMPLAKSEHTHPKENKPLEKANLKDTIMVTMILRRRTDGEPLKEIEHFRTMTADDRKLLTHDVFASKHGASDEDIKSVESFAVSKGLKILERHNARRTVVVSGTVDQMNKAFGVELHNYKSPLGTYHGHEGPVNLPKAISPVVEAIIGLDNRPVKAKHWKGDPKKTVSLTPQQVSTLYNFPSGTGAGQTIGIFEMPTSDGTKVVNPGYAAKDITDTFSAFGGILKAPKPVDVSVDSQKNSGNSADMETLMDITIAAAIAQHATIAVYFTGGDNQGIIHALQRMIHPNAGDPVPTVLSISYGWSPDDKNGDITAAEYTQMNQLFQDAANLNITVLVSSGDSGAMFYSKTLAEASYPATDPWVIACGGTSIGSVEGAKFTEYLWNDSSGGVSGATGGGISALFPVPSYQSGVTLPKQINTGKSGRGIPDVAGNASPMSGYPQVAAGQQYNGGGTSAVSPLYAGLIAVINSNLGSPVGFINPIMYSLENTAFHDIVDPPGPANNSYGGVKGYPGGKGWDACTGLGSINGVVLQTGLQNALHKHPAGTKINTTANATVKTES